MSRHVKKIKYKPQETTVLNDLNGEVVDLYSPQFSPYEKTLFKTRKVPNIKANQAKYTRSKV